MTKIESQHTVENLSKWTVAELKDGLEKEGFDCKGIYKKEEFVREAMVLRNAILAEEVAAKQEADEKRAAELAVDVAEERHRTVLSPILAAVDRERLRHAEKLEEFKKLVAEGDAAYAVQVYGDDLFLHSFLNAKLCSLSGFLSANIEKKDKTLREIQEMMQQMADQYLRDVKRGGGYDHRSTNALSNIKAAMEFKGTQQLLGIYENIVQQWGEERVWFMGCI